MDTNTFDVRTAILPSGLELAYIENGTGEPVLFFLHSLGGHSAFWEAQITALSAARRCVAPDLPGHGNSDVPIRGGCSPAQIAQDIDELRAHLGIERIILVGHGWGAQIAMAYAAAYSAHTSALIMADSGLIGDRFTPLMQTLSSLMMLTPYTRRLYNRTREYHLTIVPDDKVGLVAEALPNPPGTLLYSIYSGMLAFRYRPHLERLQAAGLPALLLFSHGRHDELAWMQQFYPAAQAEIWDNTGHYLMLQSPDRLNTVITEFLANLS